MPLEKTEPTIYRKPPAFKMRAIRPPKHRPRRRVRAESRSRGPWVALLVAVLALGGGGAAAWHWRPQILSWWQPPAPATPTITGPLERPMDSSPIAQPTPGWVWFFDESEWRVAPDEKREFVGGLLHTRQSMEKPQSQADGAIRARMTIRDGAGGVGVFLRSTSEHGRYRLFLDPDLRTIRLVHEGPDQTVELGQHRLTKSLLKGDRILLELRADGLDILGSVNEMLVIQAEDKRSKGKGTWGIDATDGWFELVEVPMPKPLVAEAKPAEPKPAEAKPVDGKPAEPMPMPEAAPAPSMPAAPASTETTKWLATTDVEWQASYEREVTEPLTKGLKDLKAQYLTTVDAAMTAATQANKKDETAYLRGEKKNVSEGADVPDKDETIVPPVLRQLRAGYRAQFAKLDKERFDHARTLHARYDAVLAGKQTLLTQSGQPAEVQEVQKRREQLAADWLKPPASAAPAPAAVVASAATPAPMVRPPLGSETSPAVKMAPRQMVEKLLSLGASVWVSNRVANQPPNAPDNSKQIESIPDLTGERFVITRVDFKPPAEGAKPLTPADLEIVQHLTDATELGLRGPAVTDALLEKIQTFRNLHKVSLEGAKLSMPGYTALAALPELRELTLRNVGAGDDAMKPIGQCRRLTRLSLANLQIGDEGLAQIGKLPFLEELSLSDLQKISSVGMAKVAECHSLRQLNISAIRLSTPMLEAVGKMAGLETVSFGGGELKDAQIVPLGSLTRLKSLNLNGTGVTGTAFAKWPVRTNLTTLNLTNEAGCEDAALKGIGQAFPKLESLDFLVKPLGASVDGFAAIGRLRHLRSLHVGGEGVNDEAVGEFAKCNSLTALTIPGARISEPGAVAIGRMSLLTSLGLNVPPITDAALKSFARSKTLKSIQIGAAAPAETEEKLKSALNGVRVTRQQ